MDRMSLHQSWHRRRSVNYRCALGLFVAGFPALVSLPEIKPETLKAWDEYIQSVDVRIKQNADGNVPFLWIDQDPVRAARVRHGEVLATPGTGADGLRAVPYGLIHDWVGAIFIPGVTAAEVFSVVHNYDRYSEFYGLGWLTRHLSVRMGMRSASAYATRRRCFLSPNFSIANMR